METIAIINQLEEDLQFMRDQLISDGPLPLAHIRLAASGVCRKWFLDRQLVKLFNALGLKLSIPALDTRPHVDCINRDGKFNFYTSGGVSIDGKPLNSIYSHQDKQNKGASTSILPIPKLKLFTVSKFLARKCVFIEGTWITAEDIIRYVANKAGGVHYDARRDKLVEKCIDRASQALWLGDTVPDPWPDGLEVYLQMPKQTNAHWNCTHIEMLSIAQGLLNLHVNGEPLVYSLVDERTNTTVPLENYLGAIQRILKNE